MRIMMLSVTCVSLACNATGKSSIQLEEDSAQEYPSDTQETGDSGTPSQVEDADGDGFDETEDCDDNDPLVHPQADERCNGVDDDCDGVIDDSDHGWYEDADGDGYGGNYMGEECPSQMGWIAAMGDCNDEDAAIYPGNYNKVDGVDSNCDGKRDWWISIYVAVDDAGELCLDGVVLGETGGWTDGRHYEVWLSSGNHTLGIYGWDLGMVITAAIAHLEISDGSTWVSDATWRYDPEPESVLGGKQGWCSNGFDDSLWALVKDIGPIGDSDNPWGNAPSLFPAGSQAHWIWDHYPVNLNSQYLRKEITLPQWFTCFRRKEGFAISY